MKKLVLSIFIILSVVSVFGQRTDEKELKSLMKDLGYSWSDTKYAILVEGESAYFWKTFYAGNDYAILAFSEKDEVYDIDIYLYAGDGPLMDQGESNEDFEMIEHTALESQQVKVVIKNYDSALEHTKYKCKFMIFYK